MRLAISCTLLASALLGLTACQAEPPDTVQAEVIKAQTDAIEENTEADEKQTLVEPEAAEEQADAQGKAGDKSIGGLADNPVARGEEETKVALATCEALDGDAQKVCKDEANAHMNALREKVKAAKSG